MHVCRRDEKCVGVMITQTWESDLYKNSCSGIFPFFVKTKIGNEVVFSFLLNLNLFIGWHWTFSNGLSIHSFWNSQGKQNYMYMGFYKIIFRLKPLPGTPKTRVPVELKVNQRKHKQSTPSCKAVTDLLFSKSVYPTPWNLWFIHGGRKGLSV